MVRGKNNSQTNRDHQRRTSYIIAEYRVKEGVFRDIIKNIGAKGLFVSTKRSIALNQDITLRFPLFEFEHEIEARGKVVRRTPNGFAVLFDSPIRGLISSSGEFPDIVHEIDRT